MLLQFYIFQSNHKLWERRVYAVMAVGGFSGNDPALTPKKLEKMAIAGEIKYFLLLGRSGMDGDQSSSVTQWIKDHCEEVPSSDWGSNISTTLNKGPFGDGMGGGTLYVYKG